jgi:hypothetical protein
MMGAQRQRTALSVLVILFLLIDGSIADALEVSFAKKNSNTKGSKWNRAQTQVNTKQKQTCAIRVKHQERVVPSKLSQAIEVSSDLVTLGSATSVNKQVTKQLALVVTAILTVTTSVSRALASVARGIGTVFRRGWWCLPMLLAVVPLYSSFVLGTPASMPSWWPLTRMDHILKSPYAKLIIGIFLGSNISYFVSGSYLLLRETGALKHATLPKTLKGYPLLGVLVLAAGSVSTVFHSVQALGCFQLALVILIMLLLFLPFSTFGIDVESPAERPPYSVPWGWEHWWWLDLTTHGFTVHGISYQLRQLWYGLKMDMTNDWPAWN